MLTGMLFDRPRSAVVVIEHQILKLPQLDPPAVLWRLLASVCMHQPESQP